MRQNYIFLFLLVFHTSCFTMESYQDQWYGPGYGVELSPEEEMRLTKKFNLPPDPGEKGKETLFGIDADNDGLRDDVQRWIYINYPQKPLIRKALRQYAIDQIESFKYINDKKKSIEWSYRVSNSQRCVSEIFDLIYHKKYDQFGTDPYESLKIVKIVENTRERFNAVRKIDSYLSGQSYGISSKYKIFSACRLKVEHPNKQEYLKRWKNWK